MAELNPSNAEFPNKSSIRWARLFTIVPKVGPVLRLTTHPSALVFENDTYTPAEAVDSSAQSESTGGEDFDTSFSGALTSDLLTEDDLNNGVYRGATITEAVIDWRYPYAGALRTYHYRLEDVSWNGEQFEATCGGLNTYLKSRLGGVCSRQCVVDLGSPECGKVLSSMANAQFELNIDAVPGDRQFNVVMPIQTLPGDWWHWGKVEFLGGANQGATGTIIKEAGYGEFTLAERPPFAMKEGDPVRITTGCDKTRGTCAGKFDNFARFQGQPYVRGADQYAPPR